jgi:hypothetical protein
MVWMHPTFPSHGKFDDKRDMRVPDHTQNALGSLALVANSAPNAAELVYAQSGNLYLASFNDTTRMSSMEHGHPYAPWLTALMEAIHQINSNINGLRQEINGLRQEINGHKSAIEQQHQPSQAGYE